MCFHPMWQLHLCTRHGMSASHCCCTAVTKQKHGFVYRHVGYTSYLYGDVWGMVYSGLFPLKLVIKIVSPPNVFVFRILPNHTRHTKAHKGFSPDFHGYFMVWWTTLPQKLLTTFPWGNSLVIPRWCATKDSLVLPSGYPTLPWKINSFNR